MSDRKILYIAMGIAFVLLLIYAITFSGTSVSNHTSDWGTLVVMRLLVSVLCLSPLYM